jgi:hypothetical protein
MLHFALLSFYILIIWNELKLEFQDPLPLNGSANTSEAARAATSMRSRRMSAAQPETEAPHDMMRWQARS